MSRFFAPFFFFFKPKIIFNEFNFKNECDVLLAFICFVFLSQSKNKIILDIFFFLRKKFSVLIFSILSATYRFLTCEPIICSFYRRDWSMSYRNVICKFDKSIALSEQQQQTRKNEKNCQQAKRLLFYKLTMTI